MAAENSCSATAFGTRFSGADPYDFDAWYPLLKDLTFETTCLPVNHEEATAMKQRCSDNHQRNQLLRWGAKEDALSPVPIPAALNHLTQQIDEVLQAGDDGGGFVRLSNRSPKDAVYSAPLFKTLLEQELVKAYLGSDAHEADQVAADMVAFVRASCLANRISSGAEAMELLCSSQRILADLTRTLLVQDESSAAPFAVSCVVRKWYSNIAPEMEFRIFVVEKRVVAITQYYKLAYVPLIAKEADRIRQLTIDFIEKQVNPRLSTVTTYTADIVFDPENLENIKLIEINNPPPLAGQALFSWDNPADQEILNGKHEGCEMRVLKTPPDPQASLAQVYQPLLPLFNELRAKRKPTFMKWVGRLFH